MLVNNLRYNAYPRVIRCSGAESGLHTRTPEHTVHTRTLEYPVRAKSTFSFPA